MQGLSGTGYLCCHTGRDTPLIPSSYPCHYGCTEHEGEGKPYHCAFAVRQYYECGQQRAYGSTAVAAYLKDGLSEAFTVAGGYLSHA